MQQQIQQTLFIIKCTDSICPGSPIPLLGHILKLTSLSLPQHCSKLDPLCQSMSSSDAAVLCKQCASVFLKMGHILFMTLLCCKWLWTELLGNNPPPRHATSQESRESWNLAGMHVMMLIALSFADHRQEGE